MTKNTVIDDAKSMASTLRSVRMTRPAEAIEKLIEAYLAQEGRIAELTKDAEPVAIVEGLINFDGRFALSYGAKVKVGDKLYTHPPAPKAITADMVTDEMVDAVEDAIGTARGAWDMVDHKELIAAACKTIGQAPIALALLTVDEVRAAYINANNDGFDFEGQLQKAFCKKNGLPHPTE